MSADDVYPNEMNESHDLDDTEAEILLSGAGHDVDPRLADLLGDLRMAYTLPPPVARAELAALMGALQPAPVPSRVSKWLQWARSSMLAKIGAATAAILATTGGLAVADALPAPIQDAVSHLGIGKQSHHRSQTHATEDTTSTTVDRAAKTVPARSAPTGSTTDEHGAAVSGIAHDHGCDPGTTASDAASDGPSQNDLRIGSCETSTTIDATTPTSIHNHDETPTTVNASTGATPADNSPSGVDDTTPTTIAQDATPSSEPPSGANNPDSSKVDATTPTTSDTSGAPVSSVEN